MQKTEPYLIENKQFVRVTSLNGEIDFKTQPVKLDIFTTDRQTPKETKYCPLLVDINQKNTNVVEFPTNGENMFIVAYSEDEKVDISSILVSGH